MSMFRTLHEAALAHAALVIPGFPNEREWPDRIRSFEDAQEVGLAVLADVRSCEPDERARRIAMAPQLWEWLMSSERVLPRPAPTGS
jgi:hypothetical protein